MSHRHHRRSARPLPASERGAARIPGIAAAVLGLAMAGSIFLVDPKAESAFDAPKRLVGMLGCALAAALVFSIRGASTARWASLRPISRASALLFGAAIGAAGLAALASPRRPVALDAWRAMVLWSLAVPLGASAALTGKRFAALVRTFLACAAVSAVLSLLEAAGAFAPFSIESASGRSGTGALIGNEGSLAIVLSLAAIASLVAALRAPGLLDRRLALASLALIFGALVVNRNITAAGSVAVGAAIVGGVLFGRKAAPWVAAVVLVGSAGVFLYRPARARLLEASRYARSGQWDSLVSYRGGPWVSAIEMIRERPVAGYGPGTFASEFVPHRLAAEIRRRERFVNPLFAGSYTEAHSEYLQAAAEAGIPAAAAALAAFALAVVSVGRLVRRGAEDVRIPALGLVAFLVTGAVAALTWFPLQRGASAIPLLLAAGCAWRLGETGGAVS